jgi:predicted SAM-dependent methyltransferase
MKLHLGCGNKILEGFINVDIRPNEGVDIIDNIGILESIEKESVEFIYCCHVLEHFGRFEYLEVLKRWYEVLLKGGTLRLSVPDLEKVFEQYKNGTSLKKLLGFLYGGQTYPQNYHYIGFDFNSLKEDLEMIGFKNIRLWDWKKTEYSHIDDFSQAYLPHMEKENGMLMSLNIEADK